MSTRSSGGCLEDLLGWFEAARTVEVMRARRSGGLVVCLLVELVGVVVDDAIVGVEAVHELEFPDWSSAGSHVVYAGPNLSFRKGNVFATVAGLFQATDVDGEPNSQLRVLLGIHF